jgi:AmmeMemoRadiSam system protein B
MIVRLILAILASTFFACATPRALSPFQADGGSALEIRQPHDTVGYTHTAEGIARVIAHSASLEMERMEENRGRLDLQERGGLFAAISPHDDYQYAQQVYIHLYPYLQARQIILIGVAHKARNFPACYGKLVFDAFDAWHGPYHEVSISPMREELLELLPAEDVYVNNEIHSAEHSLEGMIPFLQHYNREASIVPILVPYMSFERLSELSDKTAIALGLLLQEKGLVLGRDVAILISADCVHYGDQDWGGKVFADFGTDGGAYDRAVARDLGLISECLTGEISMEGLERFYRQVVAKDYHDYKVTWCGRFSIPFGLALLTRLAPMLGDAPPKGTLLRYGTTLDPGRSDPEVPGLGVTAKANLHHWVGFTAIGYR